ncbi:MAG: hypothetical protein K2G04_01835, partial [Oscillospiraceae bacterium]|nr:hypothetical protein [Oscillospiraceae bacterium]
MKKFFAVLAAACLIWGMVGCQQNDDVLTEQSVQNSIEISEMKTIEPPQNGWTLEDLLSVTYIYGNQIISPYTLESLGSNFTFDNNNVSEVENDMCSAHLYYKNMPIAAVNFNESDSKKVNSDTLINTLSFPLLL